MNAHDKILINKVNPPWYGKQVRQCDVSLGKRVSQCDGSLGKSLGFPLQGHNVVIEGS